MNYGGRIADIIGHMEAHFALEFEFEFELRFRMRTHGSRPLVSFALYISKYSSLFV